MRIELKTRGIAAAIAIAVIVLAGAGMRLLLGGAIVEAAPSNQGIDPADSPCIMTTSKHASPSSVLLGETVGVTLTVIPVCSESIPLHIVLVLDRTRGMGVSSGSANFLDEQKAATKEFVYNINLRDNPNIQIGVVTYGDTVTIDCQLTNQSGRVIGCINRMIAKGEPEIDTAVRLGHDVLRNGRSGFKGPEEIREVMILTASLTNAGGCPPLLGCGSVRNRV